MVEKVVRQCSVWLKINRNSTMDWLKIWERKTRLLHSLNPSFRETLPWKVTSSNRTLKTSWKLMGTLSIRCNSWHSSVYLTAMLLVNLTTNSYLNWYLVKRMLTSSFQVCPLVALQNLINLKFYLWCHCNPSVLSLKYLLRLARSSFSLERTTKKSSRLELERSKLLLRYQKLASKK